MKADRGSVFSESVRFLLVPDQYRQAALTTDDRGRIPPPHERGPPLNPAALDEIPAIEPAPANVSGRPATIRPHKTRYPTPYSFALPAEVAFTGRSATASRNICISSAAPASGSPICPPSATERQNAIMISNP